MQIFYSMSRKGFFPSELFSPADMPEDVVEISIDSYNALLAGESEGKVIACKGVAPYLEDRVLSSQELSANIRARRDQELTASDWTQLQDVSQPVKQSWADYRKALRGVPQQSDFPLDVTWPIKP